MPPDLFDNIDAFMLPESELLKTTTATAGIAVRKPTNKEFFRSSPHEHHQPRKPFLVYTNKEDQNYLVLPTASDVLKVMTPVGKQSYLYVNLNRDDELFLTVVGITDNSWHVSARARMALAQREWIRVFSDRQAGEYSYAKSLYTDTPTFPSTSMGDLLRAAFRSSVIDSLDHPECKKIRGVP